MSTLFEVGNTIRAYGTFRSNTITVSDGVPAITASLLADPATVTLTITDPSGARVTYTYAGSEVTKDSTGVYYRDIPLVLPGEWSIRWTGTGAVAVTTRSTVRVRNPVAL